MNTARAGEPQTRPFWSVVLPVHRPILSHLREAVESVFRSGLDPARRQFAIADDASGSPELDAYLAELAGRGVEIHRSPSRLGLVGNWNACIRLARGEWIHILHQDDRVRPGFYAALEEGIAREPALGAACTQVRFVDDAGARLREGHLDQPEAGLLHRWVQHVVVNLAIQCPAIAVRRAVYERLGGFDAGFAYCADYDMWCRIAVEYPIWFDPRPLAEYRVHPASATHRLFDARTRLREQRRGLRRAAARLAPFARNRVLRAGEHYLTRLAWRDWCEARRAARGAWARGRLLVQLPTLGRWSDLLAIRRRRYPPPLRSRAPVRPDDPREPRHPRILALSEFLPHPPARMVIGVCQHLRCTLGGLARAGHVDAAFFCFDNYQPPDGEVEQYRAALARAWGFRGEVRIISVSSGCQSEWRRRPLRALYWILRGAASFMGNRPTLQCSGPRQVARLRDAVEEFHPDLILAHRTGVAGALLRLGGGLPPVLHDLDDIEHVKIRRFRRGAAGLRNRLRAALDTWIARRSERHSARLARATLVCSEADRAALLAVAPSARVEVVPNTAREAEPPPHGADPIALFVGIAHYPPNRDAVRWLATDIWPRVRQRLPEAGLVLVGEGTREALDGLSHAGIEAVGFAESLDPHYARARICVCPIRSGSGTRIKIVEAALRARAIVSTTIGAEGLSFEPAREIVIADDAASFADVCAALLRDPARCAALGAAARARAASNYTPDIAMARVAGLARALMRGPGDPP